LALRQVSGIFDVAEDVLGNAFASEITIGTIAVDATEGQGIIDADELPSAGESQVVMVSGGDFQPGEVMTGQISGATARVDAISSLIYAGGMPWRDIVIRDFARNMPVAEGILCVPLAEQEIVSDAGYPNSDIGGLDGSGPSE
jgi:hypothetical protein